MHYWEKEDNYLADVMFKPSMLVGKGVHDNISEVTNVFFFVKMAVISLNLY